MNTTAGEAKDDIVTVDGVDYANPLHDTRYLVKIYPPPGNLSDYISLMESFERRFLHTAEGGREAVRHLRDLDDYITEKHKAFDTASGGEKELAGAALCVALLDRVVRRAKQHIENRMHKGSHIDKAEQARLQASVGEDLMMAVDLIGLVRRRHGYKDVDEVLDEMKGEPYKIFAATLQPDSPVIRHFFHNRERKAADAMVCMDKLAQAVEDLARSHPRLVQGHVGEMMAELASAAKARVQLQRDDPDFTVANSRLKEARDAIHHFNPGGEGKDGGRTAPSPTTMALLRETADLIYDVAIVRKARNTTAADLKARVVEYEGLRGKIGKGRDLVLVFPQLPRPKIPAEAAPSIDGVSAAVFKLAQVHPQMEQEHVPAMMAELAEAGRVRLGCHKGDAGLAEAEMRLTVARNALHGFAPPPLPRPSMLPADHPGKTLNPMARALVNEAADLIYDMALGKRVVSTVDMQARLEEYRVLQGRSRAG